MLATKVSEDDLKDILSAGIRVPDHGALNPWKIVVIKDDRLEKFDKEAQANMENMNNYSNILYSKFKNDILKV